VSFDTREQFFEDIREKRKKEAIILKFDIDIVSYQHLFSEFRLVVWKLLNVVLLKIEYLFLLEDYLADTPWIIL